MKNKLTYLELAHIINENRGCYLVIITDVNSDKNKKYLFNKILISESYGILYREFDNTALIDSMVSLLKVDKKSTNKSLTVEKEVFDIYIEQLNKTPEITIFGAGHVCLPLYQYLNILNLNITIYDDRDDLITKERFPAAKLICRPFDNISKHLTFDDNSYIVVITRGHVYDFTVLKQIINYSVAYIGMMGSKRRIKVVKENLCKQGFSRERIDFINCPIGLKIGGSTIQEIALSIAAEIVDRKNNKI